MRYQIGWEVRAMNSEGFRAFDRDSLLKLAIFVTTGVSTSLAWSLTRTSCVSEVTQIGRFFVDGEQAKLIEMKRPTQTAYRIAGGVLSEM